MPSAVAAPQPAVSSTQYVSDVTPIFARNGWGPVERDRSNAGRRAGDGRPLVIGGVVHTKGLGVQAPADVRYRVPAGCTSFRATVGLDAEVGRRGSASFHVLVDGKAAWSSGKRRGGQGGVQAVVPVRPESELRLVVADGGDGVHMDHADWGSARLVCNAPRTAARTSTIERSLADLSLSLSSNGWGPVERNMSNGEIAAADGRHMLLNGSRYPKGLGVHAPSEIQVTVPTGCYEFRSTVGVDDEVGSAGSVVFSVSSNGKRLWASGRRTGADAGLDLTLAVTAGSQLRLGVGAAGDGAHADHADWGLARLRCVTSPSMATPTSAPSAPTTPSPSVPAPTTPPASSGLSPLAPAGGLFTSASFWKQSIRTAPLAANSAVMVADLAQQVATRYNGNAAFNDWDYSVGFRTVGPDVAKVDVQFYDCQNKGYVPSGVYDGAAHWRGVPIPKDAVAAPGTDKNLTIWSPSTDQLWEFWVAEKTATGWRACWGGRMDNVSKNPGYFADGFGTTATGLSHAGGMVGIEEVRAGRIDHAISLNVVDAAAWHIFSWPAQRSDGYDPNGTNTIPEGTRFRLDPTINVDTLPLHPITKMIAKAAQEYGFIIQDKGGAVAVVAESGYSAQVATGTNPWTRLENGTPAYALLAGFPWHKLQALPFNYGKPRTGSGR